MEAAIRWCPHSTLDSARFMIVDVASNSLTLCRIENCEPNAFSYKKISVREKLPNFTAFDWSKTKDGLVAIGQSSGEVGLLRISSDKFQSSTIHSLPIRHQRKCNTISFNTQNLLATGLESVRNDFSINIYNVGSDHWKTDAEPYRKLSSSEAITSVKFFVDQPDTLVAGVARQCIRLYDLRGKPRDTFYVNLKKLV